MKRLATILTAAVFVVAILVPGAALASNSTCQAYNGQTCHLISTTVTATPPGGGNTPTSSGTLPFTGMDVGLLALGAAVLLSAGVAVRRLSRRLN